MRVSRFPFAPAVAILLAGLAATPAPAAERTVRPEVGHPLQQAQELLRQNKFRDALAKLREVEQAGSLSSYEASLTEQIRGIAATGAGDFALAARAYEQAIASGQLEPADQVRLTQAVGSLAYQGKDYSKAAVWLARAVKEGGPEQQLRPALAQALYLSEDYDGAARELSQLIRSAEQAGQPAPEAQLQLLANVQLKRNDTAGYLATLERLVGAYPNADLWSELILRTRAQAGFPSRLTLDALRLGLATGALASADDYTELVELALQAGLPGEALAAIRKGYAAGILGSGPQADRHARLRSLATKAAEDDLKALASAEKDLAARSDGNALARTGLALVGHGQAERGAGLIEQGLQKGGLKNSGDERLHLGIAYLAAGQKSKAAHAFEAAAAGDGPAALARLWLLHLRRPA